MFNESEIETFGRVTRAALPGRGRMDVLQRCNTAAIAAVVVGAAGVATSAYGLANRPSAPKQGRERILQITQKEIPKAQAELKKAQDMSDPNRIASATAKLGDLNDELNAWQSQLKSNLSGSELSPQPTASASGGSQTALLVVGGVALATSLVLGVAAAAKRKK